jgi:hypothetical protein
MEDVDEEVQQQHLKLKGPHLLVVLDFCCFFATQFDFEIFYPPVI